MLALASSHDVDGQLPTLLMEVKRTRSRQALHGRSHRTRPS